MKTFSRISILIFFIFTKTLFSQSYFSLLDSAYNSNIFSTVLNNNLNSANLNSRLFYTNEIGKFKFTVLNDYNSDLTKLDKNYSRDINNFNLSTEYKLKQNFSLGIGIQRKTFSDDKSVEVNQNNSNFLYTSLDYAPEIFAKVLTKVGYKTDDQIGVSTNGFCGQLNSFINGYQYRDYLINGKFNAGYENLVQKKNYLFELYGNVLKSFSNNTDNLGIIRGYTTRNDFFIPATQSIINIYGENNNIQTRTENYLYLQDNLRYFFSRKLKLNISGSFLTKNYYNEYRYKPSSNSAIYENIYDSKVSENRFDILSKIEFLIFNISSDIQISYTERSENHGLINSENLLPQQQRDIDKIERSKNNLSKITSALINLNYKLSNTNSINFSGSSSILRYDTDEKDNYDDRDELYLIALISHRYNNLNNFLIETSFEFNSSTLGYLYKERSANNNTNNIFKLTSSSTFKPVNNFFTNNYFQVLANYTVYKYEDILSQVQSFVFRQIDMWDSTRFDIKNNI